MNRSPLAGAYYSGRLTPEEIQSMEHRNFVRSFGLIRIFEPWMVVEARKHIAEGRSYKSFCGKFHVSFSAWLEITKGNPELIKIRDEYNARVRMKRRF